MHSKPDKEQKALNKNEENLNISLFLCNRRFISLIELTLASLRGMYSYTVCLVTLVISSNISSFAVIEMIYFLPSRGRSKPLSWRKGLKQLKGMKRLMDL